MSERPSDVGSLRSLWPELAPHVRPQRLWIALLIGVSVPVGFLQAGLVALVAESAVALAAGESVVTLSAASLSKTMDIDTAIGVGAVLGLVLVGLNSMKAYFPAYVVANVQARLRNDVFERFVNASWEVQSRERHGHLQEVMTSQIERTALLLMAATRMIPEGLILVGLLVSAFALAPTAALAMIVLGAALFAMLRPLGARVRNQAHAHARASEDFAAVVNESVELGEEYHVFGVEDAQAERVSTNVETVRRPFMMSKFMLDLVGGLYSSIVLVFLVGGLAGLRFLPTDRLGAVGAVVLILLRASGSAKGLQQANTDVHAHLPFMARAFTTRRAYVAARTRTGDRQLEAIDELEFVDVGYGYETDERALDGVSWRVPRATTTGLIGPSGAGKSTLVQLLLRLRIPDTGRYLVNGHDAWEYSADDWARLVSFVPQQPKLLHGTVADNIRFHRAGVTDDDIIRAAGLAHLHEEIVRLPGQYERIVGGGAAALSGGQRQRLCIARALVVRPQLLVLDEPTSALDPHSEREIQRSLAALRESGLTVFIIAHRPATLELVDRLLLLEDGRLVADGPPDEVAAAHRLADSVLSPISGGGSAPG